MELLDISCNYSKFLLQSVDEWERDVSKHDETENEMLCRLLDAKKVSIYEVVSDCIVSRAYSIIHNIALCQ